MFQAFIFVIPQIVLGVWLLMQLNEYRSVSPMTNVLSLTRVAIQPASWTVFIGVDRVVPRYEASYELASSCPW